MKQSFANMHHPFLEEPLWIEKPAIAFPRATGGITPSPQVVEAPNDSAEGDAGSTDNLAIGRVEQLLSTQQDKNDAQRCCRARAWPRICFRDVRAARALTLHEDEQTRLVKIDIPCRVDKWYVEFAAALGHFWVI